ncbi:MAG: orotate phosphoribosyltransferase [Gemmatimonadetes bacterium]|nr:MAG: orotate phosphoribosyltransferase [Gemmatimonadota bacterium]
MNDLDAVRHRLRDLLLERSVRIGDFTLASGARSDYYVDARPTTMCAEGQALVGRLGLHMLAEAGWAPSHVGGLTLGADPIAYALAHRSFLDGAPIDAFTVRKQAKAHGTGRRIEGGLPEGAAVVVIEDSVTSGGSALQAIEAVRAHGCSVLGVLALVDRDEGGRERLAGAGYLLRAAFSGPELRDAARAQSSSRSGMTRQR